MPALPFGRVLAHTVCFVVAIVLAAPGAAAQYRGTSDGEYSYSSGSATATAAVEVGSLESSFLPLDDPGPRRAESTVRTYGLRLSAPTASLAVGYAPSDSEAGTGTGWDVSAAAGVPIGLYRSAGPTSLSVHLPVRLARGYSQLSPGASEPAGASVGVGRAGLEVGLRVGLAGAPPDARGALSAHLEATLAPGVLAELTETPFDPVHAQRTHALDLEVRAANLGGGRVGATAGVRLSATRWDPAALDGASSATRAITASGFETQRTLRAVRLGLVF